MRSFLLGAQVEGSFNIPFKVEKAEPPAPALEWLDDYAITSSQGAINPRSGCSVLMTYIPVPAGHKIKVAWGGSTVGSVGGTYFIEYNSEQGVVDYWGNQGADGRTITANARTAYVRITVNKELRDESYILDVTTGEYLMRGTD